MVVGVALAIETVEEIEALFVRVTRGAKVSEAPLSCRTARKPLVFPLKSQIPNSKLQIPTTIRGPK